MSYIYVGGMDTEMHKIEKVDKHIPTGKFNFVR